MVTDYSATTWLMAAAVGCLLLIATGNVANLLFARGLQRRRELMVRSVLGATRLRLVRQLLGETVLLALAGGIIGLLFSFLAIGIIKNAVPPTLYRFQELTIDLPALLFVLGVTLLAAVLSGILPAWGMSGIQLGSGLKDEGRRGGTTGTQHHRVQAILVGLRVALACILMIGAGLLVRSFLAAQDAPLGFNPHQLLTTEIGLSSGKYEFDGVQTRHFWDQLLEKIRRLPGLTKAAFNAEPPMKWEWVRLLLKSPGFTITAVLILGLGIGANTAVFSLIQAVTLNAVPFPNSEHLVRINQPQINSRNLNDARGYVGYPDYVDLARDQHSLQNLSASYWDFLDLNGQENPQRLTAIFTTPGLLRISGLPFLLGRPFTEDEDKTGGPLVVVLSEPLWRDRFNSDPNIIGKNLVLSGETFQVIGVCPRQAEDVTTVWNDQLYVPIHVSELFGNNLQDRGSRWLMCLGRLKPGTTLLQAEADLAVVQDHLAVRYPETDKDYTIRVFPLTAAMVSSYATVIWSLGAAVVCLLLISSANVANLFLVWGLQRRKGAMIRAAIGASRFRLVIKVLTEIAGPSVLGGLVGIAIAFLTILFIKVFGPNYVYRFQEVGLDLTSLGAMLAVTLLVAFLSGILPALSLSKVDLASALKEEPGRSGTAGARRQPLQSALVIGQVGLACILLVGAELLVRSFVAAENAPLGFNSQHLLTATINPTAKKYQDPVRLRIFFDAALEKVRRLPGVTDAAMNDQQPFEWTFGDPNFPFRVAGQPPVEAGKEPTMCLQGVTPGYFKTMEIHMVQGRDFNSGDRSGSQNVMIVDAALADHFFPGQDPLGKQIIYLDKKSTWTIVGVVQNSRHNAVDRGLAPFQTYIPAAQDPDLYRQFLLVRTAGDPIDLIPAIRKAVGEVDPDIPVTRMISSDENISGKTATNRLGVWLVGFFSGVALFLSAVGLYAVLAYSVTQRKREIGVRIALGAQSSNIVRLVVQQGLRLVLIGLTLGMIAALLLVRLIESLLYGVSGGDPITLAVAVLILGLAAAIACLLPALRATRVNPITALRE